ncbi:MAG: selenium metabolism-associated LysR family transcriptional regulator [Humidesulfovibrio sp.]|uniref:selenium metabolism-associated LysR family transcriptional regulator n=1 Tax=Humidesulfovibrio sp. TaxID=2910988 RepID=UPI0027342D60|nr:selenium metabolism-associated LysR family transcriptional regulator [Humidesulfovibrio sp.]MDP2847281.1 selenium metabolism-associated LysR family transcriptional regulator [Humidesulfovibrio sp.]
MDFRKLEAFCKVYELKSFSKAGLELQLSQPTISAHVANLEEELGVPLFDRLGRTVLPTQAGEVLYRGAKQVFQQVGRINSEIGLLRDMVVGDLLLGGSTIPANYILPTLLKAFLGLYPSLRVHMTIGDTDSIIRQVGQGRLELGIVGSQPEQQGIASYPLHRDELVMLAAPCLMEGRSEPKTLRDLRVWPWILRERGSGTRRFLETLLKGAGIAINDLKVSLWVESTEAAIQCVRSGLGVSVVSKLAAQPYLDRGELVVLDVMAQKLERSFYLIQRQGRDLLPAASLFIEHVRNATKG